MKTKNIFSGTGMISTILVFLILIMSAPAIFAQDELCLSGEECLTEAQAKEKFAGVYSCKLKAVCGYEETRTAKTPKYCCKQETPTLTAAKLDASRTTATYQCPTGCECLTEADANTKFNGNYVKCSDTACGTSTIQKADGSQVQVQKYCYKSGPIAARVGSYTNCTELNCECLTEADANTKFNGNYVKCSDTACGPSNRYCYKSGQASVGANVGDKVCPSGCECLTEDNANTKFNGNYEKCAADYLTDSRCGQETITKPDGSQVLSYKYCFKAKSQQVQCPSGCECLDDAVAKEKGLKLCNNQQIRCALSTTVTAAPQYGHCYEKPTAAECPDGCECLTEEEGKKLNYNLCNNKKTECTLATGAMGVCFEKPAAGECPQGCWCENDNVAKEKGLNLCNNQQIRCTMPAVAGTAQQYGHCYEEPTVSECPTGCECLTRTEGANRKLCNNQATSCTTAAGVNGFCYEKLPTIAPFCTYDPEQDKCVNPVCPVCLRGTPKCKKFYVISETLVRDEDTGNQYSVDSFFDVFTELSVDGSAGIYAVDSFFDVFTELSVDGVDAAAGKTVCKCVCEPTEEVCPQGCECLTPDAAKEKFGNDMKRCVPDVCGYSVQETATAAAQPIAKYCYEKAGTNECPDNCVCLSEEEGKKLNYNLCNNQKRECTMATGEKGVCFERPAAAICPEGCVCVTIEQARKRYGNNFEICTDEPCYSYVTGNQKINLYCVREKKEEHICPEGCVCLKKEDGEKKGLGICPPSATECTIPGSTEWGICFELPQEERCQYNENLGKCTGGCPPGYGCVLRITPEESVVNTETGETTVITPQKRYCECIPICPAGCGCLALSEGEDMNLELCVNDDGTAKQCPIPDNKPGFCFKRIVEGTCDYDYDNNACVGTCPPGQKCQLNTIYRDPATGEVTYAECHCKEPPVQTCPDNCRCLTRAEAEKYKMPYLCDNKQIICGYVTSTDLTAAAPNALGIPKYCFTNKPVYVKCPDNCECMNKEEVYDEGYEYCNGVARECGAGFYCFQKPTVEICGKDTLVVTRRINPKIVSPPAYVNVYLSVKPVKTLNGIIITEKIPRGMAPAWDYAAVTFDPDVEAKIKESSFASEVVEKIQAKWTSRRPDSWDPDTREAKWVIRDEDRIKPQTFMYKLKAVGAASSNQIMYGFKGDWLISSGETCPIIGDEIVEIKPAGYWPPCPISDLELLRYIDMWSDGKLTDFQMLQLIKIWATAPPCPEEALGVPPTTAHSPELPGNIGAKYIIVGNKLYGGGGDPHMMDPSDDKVIFIGTNYYKEMSEAESKMLFPGLAKMFNPQPEPPALEETEELL